MSHGLRVVLSGLYDGLIYYFDELYENIGTSGKFRKIWGNIGQARKYRAI